MPSYPVVPPHEAGARIRVLATRLLEVMEAAPIQQGYFAPTNEVSYAWDRVLSAHHAMEVAMQTRRATVMRVANADYHRATLNWREKVHTEASRQIKAKTATLPPHHSGQTAREMVEELRSLANNLPTQEDLPSADSRDTALRAIIAVLRTHEFPGTEGLTHQAKEDQHAKTEVVGDAAVPGVVQGQPEGVAVKASN